MSGHSAPPSVPSFARARTQRSAVWLTFSEGDERYPDLTRILLAVAVLTLTVVAVHQEFRGEPVDLLALGSAYAALLVGGGIGIGGRARLEDGNPMDAQPAITTTTTTSIPTGTPLP